MKKLAVLVLATGVMLVVMAPNALADAQDVAREVSEKIISPFCPGVTLHDCPSADGDQMRREILAMAESGMTADEIIDELVAERGDAILATPSNPFARLLPALLVAFGAIVALFLMSRWTKRRALERASEASQVSDKEHRRIEKELERFRTEA